MSNDIRHFVKGIKIEPVVTSEIDAMGELEVLLSDGGLYYHNGTVKTKLVTTNGPQTITGTTIDGDDNTILDLSLTSIKTTLGDANRIIQRNALGAVISSDVAIDSSENISGLNNITATGTLYLGPGTINAASILQADSTSKGFLPPRMNALQRNAITSPPTGLLIFNTTDNQYNYYDGTLWALIGSGGGGVVLAFQEPIGTGNGVQTSFGPLTNTPNTEESVIVLVDGIVENDSLWSLSGSNIVFATAPAAAQTIYVFYMYGAGSGGGGEANTASNVGTGGVGLFEQKTGVDLEFKNINAGSNKVTITDDVPNSEVDIDINESNLTLNNIGGTLGPTKGGTGQTTYTTGDTLYASASNTLSKLPIGSSGQVLTVSGGIPSWATSSGAVNTQTITASGSFIVPTGVTTIFVTGVGGGGGGGGGGGATNDDGGGGGGGGNGGYYGTATLIVTPAETLTVTIGAAGSGGSGGDRANGTNGSSGGTTALRRSGGSYLFVTAGGDSGKLGSVNGATGGVGGNGGTHTTLGTVSGGASNTNGSSASFGFQGAGGGGGATNNGSNGGTGGSADGVSGGPAGTSINQGGGGGASGSTPYGVGATGGTGGTPTSNGTAGSTPAATRYGTGGGGGGGGFGTGSPSGVDAGGAGGSGVAGAIVITWFA